MNHDILAKISSMAVWGSLVSALMLGVFSIIQGFINNNRGYRLKYLMLGMVSLGAAAVDLFHPYLPIKSYEALRIIFWGLYGPAVVALLFQSHIIPAVSATILLSVGLYLCLLFNSAWATSFVIPLTFYVAACAFALRWRRDGGYALSILTVISLAQGTSSILYIPVVLTENNLFISLGYLHFGLISILGVVLGWVHLPLELQGRNHVRVTTKQFSLLVFSLILAELIILPSLAYSTIPIEGYSAGTLLQLSVLMGTFLLHRHDLLIFTDDVRKLLTKRTQSLTATKEKLKDINAEQARILAEQAYEITAKTAVIERQRRLELVAETTGQVAHDIQNIAVPMLRLTATDRDFKLNDLERLRYHVKELLDLNDQLLALSSRRRVKLRPVLTVDVIRAATSWLSDEELKLFEISCTGSYWINGVESQLTRAVGNLAKNALDAVNRKSGKIVISCREVDLTEPRRCFLGNVSPGPYVAIEVRDNGHGIPSAIREKIFDPYFSVKPNGKVGTGLGLTIVSTIVRDHGGVIDLKSDENGTSFEILFPAVHTRPEQQSASRQNRTIGVLDWNSLSCIAVKEWLRTSNQSYQLYESLTEFYHAASTGKFNTALLASDISSKQLAEILFAIKNLSPHTEIRFFSVSPSDSAEFISVNSGHSDDTITSQEELTSFLSSPPLSESDTINVQVH